MYSQSYNDYKIKIECNTDKYQLYDFVHSITPMRDKRLIIEISLLREMLTKKEITKINWIEKQHQLADCSTKSRASPEILINTFKTKSTEFLYKNNS